MLEPNPSSINNKKSITVSSKTYERLISIGKFSDRTFDHLITRLLDEREGKENSAGGSFYIGVVWRRRIKKSLTIKERKLNKAK